MDILERDLHPLLVSYLNRVLDINCKTIYQEKSTNRQKGLDEWIHPDIVGYKMNFKDKKKSIIGISKEFNNPKVTLYSFELKRELTIGSIRENFFQAVSNSSWANEGFLVAAKIDKTNHELMKKMRQLSNSFGIGIIHLNVEDVTKSEWITEPKRKENVDVEAMENLASINEEYDEFLGIVDKSLKIDNEALKAKMDKVLTDTEIKMHLEKCKTKREEGCK